MNRYTFIMLEHLVISRAAPSAFSPRGSRQYFRLPAKKGAGRRKGRGREEAATVAAAVNARSVKQYAAFSRSTTQGPGVCFGDDSTAALLLTL